MSSDDTQPTKIEQLPIEIFREIFDFFSLDEIAISFFGLNSRIDSIIRSMNTASHTVSSDDAKAVDLLNLFSTQIGRLIVKHNQKVNFMSLINLQSLTIAFGSAAQFSGIRPKHVPALKILHIEARHIYDTTNVTSVLNDLFRIILSNGFPRLRTCTGIGIEPVDQNETWTGSPALRVLILNVRSSFACQQVHSLCPNLRQFKSASYLPTNPSTGESYSGNRRVLYEIGKIQKWEYEKKFILESCSVVDIYNSLASSNNTRSTEHSYNVGGKVIHGRILPTKDPYCFASFLIEIQLSSEYPFKMPEVIFLDPIYHPAIRKDGHCCCCFFKKSYRPTTPLVDLIRSILNTIDNSDLKHCCSDFVLADEYHNNYEQFYEKALEYTLKYGRPRY